jgi:hypothetical protein
MLCLAVGAVLVPLMTNALTLAWAHSVEKTLWEEDWQETPLGLELIQTRVRGSGAGMEPAPDARLIDGAWTWRPALPRLPEVALRRSGATNDWQVCIAGRCRPMGAYVPADADPVSLRTCPEKITRAR